MPAFSSPAVAISLRLLPPPRAVELPPCAVRPLERSLLRAAVFQCSLCLLERTPSALDSLAFAPWSFARSSLFRSALSLLALDAQLPSSRPGRIQLQLAEVPPTAVSLKPP
ncbi:hypothetical protein Zm00014a_012343 [Zea mays]|uniref:Uncharacterized protein n=1 Tax=Zea mays TaxID=4577 RepID=A0A3L6DSV5_MAIZE|nr:hypothetical protein Zm00014a_012343 [Zea mays]